MSGQPRAAGAERIFLSPPDVGEAEERAVVRALRSGWAAPLGPEVDAFEREVATRVKREHAVALSSGTAALHLGLLGVGAGPGDVVITATMTFVATANAISYTGATPVFVDSDPVGNIDPELLERAVADQRRRGRRIAAIVPVDVLGRPAAHELIGEQAAAAGIPVVVDAAESLGARRAGRPAGGSGDAAILSFNGNKIMTTSGGGMLLTDDADLARRARFLATQAREPVAHYEHTQIGYNYRLSNLLAALGRAQLGRLDAMIERRRAVRARYADFFGDVEDVTLLDWAAPPPPGTEENYWLTSILVTPGASWAPRDLMDHLAAAGIESRPLWKPMHRQPVFRGSTAYLGGCSDRLFATGLSLPSGSGLGDAQLDRVLAAVAAFLARSARPGAGARTVPAPARGVPAGTGVARGRAS